MMAAAFTLMPLPSMFTEQTTHASANQEISAPAIAYTAVARAGVAINGKMVGAVDPIRIGGLYYVPFKQIAGILNYRDIRYNISTKTYCATDGSVTVRATIGGTRAMKGDEVVTIHAPRWVRSTTYISVDAVSSLFNTFTYYQPQNGSLQIQMPARTYKVLATDTIWKIAQIHHTTVGAIREANGLTSNLLKPGQILRLPAETMTKEMEPSRQSGSSATPAQAPTTATQSSLAAAIIATGKQCMGAPYVFGAKPSQAPRAFDCSSFMQYIFGKHGITLPRDSRVQAQVGFTVTALKPGDLLFFKYPEHYSDGRVGHVGVYIGNGQMLHTIPRTGVTITNYTRSSYWMKNFLFAKRVIR